MNKPIFIEYETKSREFDGKLLLITNLLQFGYTNIFLGTNRYLRKLALKNANGIYFFKSLSKNEENLYSQLKNNGYKLVLLHAEGGVHYKDNESTIRSIFNPEVSHYIDYNFLFGDYIKTSIDKYNVRQKDQQMVTSGDPRFDLLKAKYDSFFTEDISNITENYGDFILINTSFSASNPQNGIENARIYWQNEPTFTKETKDLLMLKMDYFVEIIDYYLKAIAFLATELPSKTFVVRPHPSESLDIYLQHFKDYKNVHVTKKGNVAMWIKASKGVIHFDCTTGIEALIAGKPVIAYVPKFDERIVAWLPIAVSKKITELESLKSQIEYIFDGKFKYEVEGRSYKILEQTINNVSFESSPIISGYLSSNVPASFENKEKTGVISHLVDQINHNFRIRIKKFIYRIINRSDVEFSKKGKFNKEEVRIKLNKLNQIQGFSVNFKLKMLTIDCIQITKAK